MRHKTLSPGDRQKAAMVVFFGVGWGLLEAALPLGLRAHCPAPLLGAILSGSAFFFLSACGSVTKSFWAPLKALLLVLLLKIAGIWVADAGNPLEVAGGPLTAYILQALTFSLILATAGDRFFASGKATLLFGALAGGTSSLLYAPALTLLGQKACLFSTTTLPASLVYAPMVIALASISALLGASSARVIMASSRFPASGFRNLVKAVSLAAFLLTLAIYRL